MKFSFSADHKQDLKFLLISGLSIFVFLFLSNLFLEDIKNFDILETILIILLLWIGCALISYLLHKKYSWQEHIYKRFLLQAFLILILIAIVVLVFGIIPNIIHDVPVLKDELKINTLVMILISFAVSAIGETRDILLAWKETVVRTNQLEKENIQTQFNVLKSQVNPHFLFNSLNTLATYVQDLPEVNMYVKNLSEYLRHTLTIKEDVVISINEELSVAEKYAYLQKARFKNNLIIDIDIPQKLKEYGYIPPFCVQILLENAIKHNIISKSKPLFIKIYTTDGNFLVIENNLQIKETQDSTKLGLKNIAERYKLISGKSIIIEETDAVFRVSLPVLENILH
jgi:two-component system LytT family sensor kinase